MQLFSSWTGSDFLLFYTILLVASALAASWIPAMLSPSGQRAESPDAEDIAILAGGSGSHADCVLADLFARGGLSDEAAGKFCVVEAGLPASPAGRALLAAREPFSRGDAEKMLASHARRIAARLQRGGLMLRSEELARLRWLSITPFAALFLIGLYRQRAGSVLGEPTGLLVALMGLTVVLAVICFARVDRRTIAGIEAVRRLRADSSRLRRAPQPGEAALAVALFGTGVLAGTPWEPLHAMRQQSGDASSNSDSSSSDGGSGCGGGGCGGCGG